MLILRSGIFRSSGVFCSCNQRFIFRVYILKMYAFSALNTLWRLPGVFSWCLRRFWFRTYNRILFCTIIGPCCVLRPCIPWPLACQCTVHYCESVPFCTLARGRGDGRVQFAWASRFCLSTILCTFTQRKCLKHFAVIKVITGSNLCLLTALCVLRMLFCGRRPSSVGMYAFFFCDGLFRYFSFLMTVNV